MYPDLGDYINTQINTPDVLKKEYSEYKADWIKMIGGVEIAAKRAFKDKFKRA
jgi:phosphoserine aminotransferase